MADDTVDVVIITTKVNLLSKEKSGHRMNGRRGSRNAQLKLMRACVNVPTGHAIDFIGLRYEFDNYMFTKEELGLTGKTAVKSDMSDSAWLNVITILHSKPSDCNKTCHLTVRF